MFLPCPGQGHLLSLAATAWGGMAILPPLLLSWRPLSVVFIQTSGASTRAEGGPMQLVDTGAKQLVQCRTIRVSGLPGCGGGWPWCRATSHHGIQ